MLDNCEHLVGAAAVLVAALRRIAPRVAMLATSQEPLRIEGEQLYRLSPLAVPAEAQRAHAGEFGAVALFVARVQALAPRFALATDTVDDVVEVCRRLDGIPLALELAAARVPLLGVTGVRARLDDSLRLLSSGARDAPPRQQTLRAALAWSHQLLTPEEQCVFRRLGVFAGSFALEFAQQALADDSLDAWTVLDHLGSLVDKSLVIAEGAAVPRYRLLETARAFALEQLDAAGEAEALRARHAAALRAAWQLSLIHI